MKCRGMPVSIRNNVEFWLAMVAVKCKMTTNFRWPEMWSTSKRYHFGGRSLYLPLL